mmetsp:Transcript_118044/g.280225  ORF Transcript_118044/g.280225 Transcript_118044/m.280225 type:complete len:247 (-) Transcript_118044:2088-2828(-)
MVALFLRLHSESLCIERDTFNFGLRHAHVQAIEMVEEGLHMVFRNPDLVCRSPARCRRRLATLIHLQTQCVADTDAEMQQRHVGRESTSLDKSVKVTVQELHAHVSELCHHSRQLGAEKWQLGKTLEHFGDLQLRGLAALRRHTLRLHPKGHADMPHHSGGHRLEHEQGEANVGNIVRTALQPPSFAGSSWLPSWRQQRRPGGAWRDVWLVLDVLALGLLLQHFPALPRPGYPRTEQRQLSLQHGR